MSKADDVNKTLSQILDEIEEKNVKAELEESKVPQIGIYYVIKNDVMVDSVPENEVITNRGIKVYKKQHRTWWKEIQAGLLSLKPLTTGKSYDYYPRGRVTYIEADDRYIIFQDPCISKVKTKEIARFFNLPYGKYEVRKDEHYKCHKCQKR